MNDLITRIKLLFHEDKELFYELRNIIGFFPGNIEFYKTALMHKSIMHRNEKGKPVNNERLEFLGDAVLGAVVSHIAYNHFPGKREGFLTTTRSKLVKRDTLGRLAEEMGITRLIVSSGRNQTHNSYMGGNAFEALVGAIYLDKGYKAAQGFVEKQILSKLINIDKVAYKEMNFKSKLLEWTQKNRIKIEFNLVDSTRDEHSNPVFAYQIVLEGVEGCSGRGYTKKESQQQAAKLTLEKLRKNKRFQESIFQAKSERTKMEEESVFLVPDGDAEISINAAPNPAPAETPKPKKKTTKKAEAESDNLDFDLSDITTREPSRDDIIAAAEETAFNEEV